MCYRKVMCDICHRVQKKEENVENHKMYSG